MKKNIKYNIILNSIGLGINAFSSLFYLIMVTRMNGIKLAGYFTFGFSISTLFNIIGIYFGRIYQVTDNNNKYSDNDYFINRLITCFLMILTFFIFVLLKNYNSVKSIIVILLCLFRTFEAFAEILYGYYQKRDELYKVGISLIIKNVLSLLTFLLIDYFTNNLILSIISINIIHILVIIFYDFKILRIIKIDLFSVDLNKQKKILSEGFSPFILTFSILLLINMPRFIIDNNLSDDMSTIFGILIMPATIMTLISQFCLHPFLNQISDYVKKKKFKKLNKLVNKINFVLFLFGLFAIICAYLVGIPFLEFVYNIDLSNYLISLIIIISGSIFYGLATIYSNVLVALRKINMQFYIYLIVSLLFYIICKVLIVKYTILGVTISYLISMFILMLIMKFIFYKYIKNN